ncbi:hypothetical protein OF83DRAFT_389005 [Amylostereum chailletii]|nr:hypothetical protein OF83DRAFT_389005 [Amylostereum chailletii]
MGCTDTRHPLVREAWRRPKDRGIKSWTPGRDPTFPPLLLPSSLFSLLLFVDPLLAAGLLPRVTVEAELAREGLPAFRARQVGPKPQLRRARLPLRLCVEDGVSGVGLPLRAAQHVLVHLVGAPEWLAGPGAAFGRAIGGLVRRGRGLVVRPSVPLDASRGLLTAGPSYLIRYKLLGGLGRERCSRLGVCGFYLICWLGRRMGDPMVRLMVDWQRRCSESRVCRRRRHLGVRHGSLGVAGVVDEGGWGGRRGLVKAKGHVLRLSRGRRGLVVCDVGLHRGLVISLKGAHRGVRSRILGLRRRRGGRAVVCLRLASEAEVVVPLGAARLRAPRVVGRPFPLDVRRHGQEHLLEAHVLLGMGEEGVVVEPYPGVEGQGRARERDVWGGVGGGEGGVRRGRTRRGCWGVDIVGDVGGCSTGVAGGNGWPVGGGGGVELGGIVARCGGIGVHRRLLICVDLVCVDLVYPGGMEWEYVVATGGLGVHCSVMICVVPSGVVGKGASDGE